MQSALSPGQVVRVRGRAWVLRAVTCYRACRRLDLESLDAAAAPGGRSRVALLEPFDRPARIGARAPARVISRRAWMASLRLALLRRREPSGLAAPVSADIDLLPHQLEPALAVVHRGLTRLLLADGVGLGKTIEAGLVMAELHARNRLTRGLAIVPAGLRDQWAAELAGRLGLDATVADAGWLRACREALPSSVNPWSLPGIYVASFDFAKRAEVLLGLAPVTWDAFVVDEAHLAAGDSDRRAAAHALASRARVVLLLTATPHSGDPRTFEALTRIGCLGSQDRPAVFRRTRAQAGLDRERRVSIHRVRGGPPELDVRRHLDDYIRSVWTRKAGDGATDARLAMTVLLKRSFSGMAPLRRSLEARLAGLAGGGAPTATQMALAWDEDVDGADDEPSGVLAAPGLADEREERAVLAALAERARAAEAGDSKRRAVLGLIRRVPEPCIVFTEYRDTLSSLHGAAGDDTGILHGGLDRASRANAIARFTRGDTRVLLATDAAGEGLNLHRRCRLVVNLELPWNPVRLEQRIGRVDRIGQSREVRVVNLVAAGTAEAALFARLASRLHLAREAVGPIEDVLGHLDEEVVADQIGFGLAAARIARPGPSARSDPALVVSPPPELAAQAASLAEWIGFLRRLSRAARRAARRGGHGSRAGLSGGIGVTACRRAGLPSTFERTGALAFFRVTRGPEGGSAGSSDLVPVFVDRRVPALRRAGDVRRLADAFIRDEAPALARVAASRAARIERLQLPFDRGACLARRARARPAAQRGLFDARAEREALAGWGAGTDELTDERVDACAATLPADPGEPAAPVASLELLLFITD